MGDMLTLLAVFIIMFLFGMTILRIGLYQLSYHRMKGLLSLFADHPIKGMLTGIVVTGILQSSSCTMIITVGLVAVGALSFKQSIGIMLGANIGTTVTVELLSLSHQVPIWPLLVTGCILLFFQKPILFGTGGILFGLGTMFVALHGFSTLAEPIQQLPIIQEMLAFTNLFPSLSIAVGTLLTAIIQSSTASTGIAMSFLDEGLFTMPSAIGIMLGANIGTCITAWLASLGSNHEAKLVAMAHVWLNLIGVLIFAPFLEEMAMISGWLANSPMQQLAHISVLFNVLSSIIVLPFLRHFTSFVLLIHGKNRT
ncbi:Na/Pi cotransporter family protein [Pontibacillus yanchengensis]|uniref:Na/Pi cotransporter family protein n=2 Tax=Pontibacillus yanchengensis TaxID=462910 RepID=A0ACC7VDG6_9BACI|nr:Na/Pi symporter [Pontibacillus yanchengensis]MYL33423.1 Na/Pi cotransporter family protein [Pontibacillus yanchengensis]MYL53473.1 Na/Pi cotransporter family protein [Pontibacillus yanchengensis]